MRALRSACRPSGVAGGFIADLTRSRAELVTENALLRQQLIVAARAVKRPAFRVHERGLLVLLASLHRQWRRALLLVKPETVLRWHREGFRLFWRRSSRSSGPGEPRLAPGVVARIQRLATENRLWGAERIRGELLKLGIRVAKRTVQRCMRGARPPGPRVGQSWRTFLGNHTVWACDFLQTYDIEVDPILRTTEAGGYGGACVSRSLCIMHITKRQSLLRRDLRVVIQGDPTLDAKRRRGQREGGDWQVGDEAVDGGVHRHAAFFACPS
ncbi:MAG: helix-turn-helix domain-containing protein [Polyangiaceae bacterium]